MLSGNINIEDDDWDSVRQGYAALTRDLERIYLSYGLGGNDFGGGTPKSANDQSVAQDGNYGYNAVTTDMLDALEAQFNEAIDSAVSSIPQMLWSMGNKTVYTSGTNTFTVPSGVSTLLVQLIGAGGGGGNASADASSTTVDKGGVADSLTLGQSFSSGQGGGGAMVYAVIPVTPGEQFTCVVGSGGAAASGTPANGSDGGDTTIKVTSASGPQIIASGGKGGKGLITRDQSYGYGGYGACYDAATLDRLVSLRMVRGLPGVGASGTLNYTSGFDIAAVPHNGHALMDGSSGERGTGYGGLGRFSKYSAAPVASQAGGAGAIAIFY